MRRDRPASALAVLDGFDALVQVNGYVERADLLHQALDQFTGCARRNRRDVVNRLVRIQLDTLPADTRQYVDDVTRQTEQRLLQTLQTGRLAPHRRSARRYRAGRSPRRSLRHSFWTPVAGRMDHTPIDPTYRSALPRATKTPRVVRPCDARPGPDRAQRCPECRAPCLRQYGTTSSTASQESGDQNRR